MYDKRVEMRVNGLTCAFHMPKALIPRFHKVASNDFWKHGDGVESRGEEVIQPLPPGEPRFAYQVDEYNCPENWMHGSSKASSYWLPVRPGCGMWLDFNQNQFHSHHVAVVLSIQGVNPITGQQTKVLRLEQYRERCPVHDIEFGQDRFCEQCNYKWDAQNYISSNSTPKGMFWIDGFRSEDGVVRQYIFTEETCKGVAANIIGDDRVFAIGIAFYLSRDPKPVTKSVYDELSLNDFGYPKDDALSMHQYASGNVGKLYDSNNFVNLSNPASSSACSSSSSVCNNNKKVYDTSTVAGGPACGMDNDIAVFKRISLPLKKSKLDGGTPSNTVSRVKMDLLASQPQMMGVSACSSECDYDTLEHSPSSSDGGFTPEEIEKEMKKMEITAGARIRQKIFADPEQLSFWNEEPEGFIYINYVDIDTAEKLMKSGRKERSGSYLDKVMV